MKLCNLQIMQFGPPVWGKLTMIADVSTEWAGASNY